MIDFLISKYNYWIYVFLMMLGFYAMMGKRNLVKKLIGMNIFHGIILGMIIGIVGQISDLVESLIKRDAGVKDSSNMIPGHGGFLDRFDSLLFSAPLFYYFLKFANY